MQHHKAAARGAPAHASIDTLWPPPAGLHAQLPVALVAVKVVLALDLLLALDKWLHHLDNLQQQQQQAARMQAVSTAAPSTGAWPGLWCSRCCTAAEIAPVERLRSPHAHKLPCERLGPLLLLCAAASHHYCLWRVHAGRCCCTQLIQSPNAQELYRAAPVSQNPLQLRDTRLRWQAAAFRAGV